MNRREAFRVNRDTEILNRNAASKIRNLSKSNTGPSPTPKPNQPSDRIPNSDHLYNSSGPHIRSVSKFSSLFAEAIEEWDFAWKKEEQDETEEAAKLFQSAQKKCQRATEMCKTNDEYRNWAHVISLKIDGDSLFNEGYSWQDRANQSYNQELYEDALRYYNLALAKYKEGLHRSRDKRFQDCLEIVQKQIGTTRQAIDRIRAVSMTTSGQRDQHFVMHA